MNDTTKHDDDHPVRKLLQSLPKITTGEDFTRRLHERLAKEPQRSFWSSVDLPPIPAYSLSIAGLAVAGAILYFSFMKTDITPIQQPSKQTEIRQQEQPQQTPSQVSKPTQETRTPGTQDITQHAQGSQTRGSVDTSLPAEGARAAEPQQVSSMSARQPFQDAQQRTLLREVGGTGLRVEQPADTSPFLRSVTSVSIEAIYDSIARSDSLKRDSLMKPIQKDQEGE